MGTIAEQIGQALLRLLANSKLPSELAKIWRLLSPIGFVVQSGSSDAQYAEVAQVRGYLGSYNASTNEVTLGDSSTMQLPNNLNAVAGEWVTVSVAGSHDFGNGSISVIAGDRLRFDGLVWYKESPSESPLVVPENEQLLIKRDGKTGDNQQTGDLVAWKKVNLNGNQVTVLGAKYLGPDPLEYTSYTPGIHIWINDQRFFYAVGDGNDGLSLQIGDLACSGVFEYQSTKFYGDLICIDNTGDTTTGIGVKWQPLNLKQLN